MYGHLSAVLINEFNIVIKKKLNSLSWNLKTTLKSSLHFREGISLSFKIPVDTMTSKKHKENKIWTTRETSVGYTYLNQVEGDVKNRINEPEIETSQGEMQTYIKFVHYR